MSEEKKEELTQEEKNKIEFNKQIKFAQGSVSSKNVGEISSSRSGVSFDQLQSALQDPYSNVSFIQQVSKILYASNGIYYRLIENFTNIPMYDLYLSPTTIIGFNGKSNTVDKMNKEYEQIAQLIEKINYKYNFKWFGRQLLLYGELFLYKVEDNNGIFYKAMPNDICRISGVMENNILKYSLNLSKLSNANLLSTMPVPIQKLYEKFANGSLANDEKLVDNYYYLEENEAVAFLFDDGNIRNKGISPFCYLFDKIYRVDEIEDDELSSTAADNLKLIHMKIPTNEEGELMMDTDIIGQYHQAAKQNLPKGCAITTNPLNMEVFTTQRQAQSTLTASQKAYESVYTSSGVNSELFNGARSSNESVLNSIKTDEMVVDRLNLIFCNFINYEIKNKKRNAMWKVEMLRNTYFNKKDIQASERESITIGGNKLRYLAACGYTPLTALSSLLYESTLGLEQYFHPVTSSYNSANGEDNGRPSNSENDNVENNTGQAENGGGK